jgi:hypothetical protein
MLAATLDLIEPVLVVSLGGVALRALHLIQPHGLSLAEHVGTLMPWGSTHLFPLYHPGSRARTHRPFARQVRDFFSLAETVDLAKSRLRKRAAARRPCTPAGPALTEMQRVAAYMVQRLRAVSWFKLSKLLYLVDYASLQARGSPVTEGFYINQKSGPWATTFGRRVSELLQVGVLVRSSGGRSLSASKALTDPSALLSPEDTCLVDSIVERYGHLSEAQVKTRVYLTPPMKAILRQERAGRPTHNAPVFRDLTRDSET